MAILKFVSGIMLEIRTLICNGIWHKHVSCRSRAISVKLLESQKYSAETT